MAAVKSATGKEMGAPAFDFDKLSNQKQAPSHIAERTGPARGSENVESRDILIPRIEVAQALSKCLKKQEAGYIAGSVEGHLYNNVTRQLYGTSVVVCPIFFRKEYLIWVDRKKGSGGTNGFRGSYGSEEEALRAKKTLDDADKCEVVETHVHFVVLAFADGRMEDAVISMAKTKLKVSRNWNSLIRLNGGDRFSRLYRVSTTPEKNDKGDFQNFVVANLGFTPEAIYRRAEMLYDLAAKGYAKADHTYDGDGEEVPDNSEI